MDSLEVKVLSIWSVILINLSPVLNCPSLNVILPTKIPANLPDYTLSEVSKHNTRDDAWIALFGYVYDVTDWISVHPGGDKILNACYSNARLLVYPSLYEGFGMPILEAFENNCPVVCSDSSSLPEVADDAALYFNPKDEQSMYDSISKICYSDQLRNELLIKGKDP